MRSIVSGRLGARDAAAPGAPADEAAALARRRLLLVGGGVAAALQIGFAARLANAPSYLDAVVLAWAGALWLIHHRRPRPPGRPHLLERALGAGLFVAACGLTILNRHRYHPVHRLMSLAAGGGLIVMAEGVGGLRQRLRECTVLGLTLIDPLPGGLQRAIMPDRQTAATAAAILEAVGFPVERSGTLLFVPGATLEVLDICSGLESIAQLLALAVLVVCVFKTTWLDRVLLAAVAVFAGFSVNATRVAVLAVIASRAPDRWAFWERPGAGSHAFPLLATALAGVLWWLVLRRRAAPARTSALPPP